MDISKAAHFVQKPLRLFHAHTFTNLSGRKVLQKPRKTFRWGQAPPTPAFRFRLPSLGCCEIFFGSNLKRFLRNKNLKNRRRKGCFEFFAFHNFFAREIDTMKKNPNYSKIIILARIYSIDGIDEVQNDANSLKQKKKYTRGKIDKILTRFKTNGLIQGYKFHKKVIGKATTFYSVEILL